MNLSEIVDEAHATALDKGFWDHGYPHSVFSLSTKLCLVHSEVSEALEVLRSHRLDDGIANFGEELADIIIRVADLAGFLRIDLDQAVQEKMAKNKNRPTRHGKSF